MCLRSMYTDREVTPGERIAELRQAVSQMKEYLQLRFTMSDWHGVMDAAADIRELEAQIKVLTEYAERA